MRWGRRARPAGASGTATISPQGTTHSERALFALFLALSILVSLSFHRLWPTEWLVDDGAIVLRYMDVFAQGGFFQYNLEDPPVFGLSGFIHGLLAGILSGSHLTSPDHSVLLSNALGVALTSMALLLILRHFATSTLTSVLAWAFCLTASHYFVVTAFQGLETPLHVGIVLLAYWAFLAGRSRALWLLLALAVISKLDAVPVAIVLGAFQLHRSVRRSQASASLRGEVGRALRWAGLLLGAWVLFTFWLFGSPLPQSAFAKLVFHSHPPSRLAFLEHWMQLDEDLLRWQVLAAILLPMTGLAWRSASWTWRVGPWALLLGSSALLGLYVFYNPGERMAWYYALPQTLLILGAVTGLLQLETLVARRSRVLAIAVTVAVLAGAVPYHFAHTRERARQMIGHIRSTEPERAAVGRYVRDHSSPGDRLYVGYGYIARAAGIYTYDASGLNSPIVTRLRAEGKGPLGLLGPEWSVRAGLWPPEAQVAGGWELLASFYGRSCDGRAAWRVFRNAGTTETRAMAAHPVSQSEVLGEASVRSLSAGALSFHGQRSLRFACRAPGRVRAFQAGIAREPSPLDLEVSFRREGHDPVTLSRVHVPAQDPTDFALGRSWQVRIELPPGASEGESFELRLTLAENGTVETPFGVLEPVWMTEIAR